MRHRISQKKLGRDTNERRALLRGLAKGLILHERINTTEAKAKAVRPVVEKLITRAKENTIANRRLLVSKLGGAENVVSKLLEVVGPHFKERAGGYTRIIKMPPRKGDNARMALIEFVDKVSEVTAKKKLEQKTAKVEGKVAKDPLRGASEPRSGEREEKPVKKTAAKVSAKKTTRVKKETTKKAEKKETKKEEGK